MKGTEIDSPDRRVITPVIRVCAVEPHLPAVALVELPAEVVDQDRRQHGRLVLAAICKYM